MKKSFNLNFYSNCIWRRLFFLKKNKILKYEERFILTRSSAIPRSFKNIKLYIYNGHIWVPKLINRWVVGYKFGQFTWNRKIALYKAKQLKKKKK